MAERRIAVFASGNGSNFQVLADAAKEGELGAEIGLLVTDRPYAYVVQRAAAASVPVLALQPEKWPSKAAYEEHILQKLQVVQADWIVLAGYMRLIGPTLLYPFKGKMINLHPSLLPAFPGKDAIGQAWRYGVKITGATVHYVDEGMDTGPIIDQQAVRISHTDTLTSLQAKIHAIEHDLLLKVVRRLCAQH